MKEICTCHENEGYEICEGCIANEEDEKEDWKRADDAMRHREWQSDNRSPY